MSDGKLTITIDGDEAKAHAAYISLTKDQKELVAEIGKMGIAAEAAADKSIKAAKAESKERQDQIRLAQSLVKANETLTQAYDRQAKALDSALAAGEITADQHKQTLTSLAEKIRMNSTEYQQAMEAEKMAAQTLLEAEKLKAKEIEKIAKAEESHRDAQLRMATSIVEKTKSINDKLVEQKAALLAAKEAGVITFDEYSKGLDQIRAEAELASGELEEFKFATEEGVGQKSVGKVVEFAAKFATIAAAVGIVKKALEFYNAEKEKAMGSTDSLVDVRKSLSQVSKGDFDKLENRSDELTRFGLDRVQARQLVFDARSSGFEGEEEAVAKASTIMDVKDATSFAGEFRKFFADEKLTIEQSLNTAISAASESLKDIRGVLPQIRTAAQGRLAGGESSDISAAVAVLGDKFGDSVGDRVRSLGIELATNEATRGTNMIDAMQKVLSDPALRKEIEGGSKEVMAADQAFSEFMPRIQEIDKKIEAAQKAGPQQGLLQKAVDERLDENTQSGRIERARQSSVHQKAMQQRANETARSEEAYGVEAAKSKVNAEAIESGDDVMVRMVKSATASALGWLGFSPSSVEFNSKAVGSMAKDGQMFEDIKNRRLDADLDDVNSKIRLATLVRKKLDAGEDPQKINQLLERNGNLSIDELKTYEGMKETIPVYADPRDNPRSINSDDELKRQTSAIERQTSTLSTALNDISEKLNFQAV